MQCPPEFRRALAAHTTLNLAYVDRAGAPQVCAVFYSLTESGTLVFLSSRSTRHGRALTAGPLDTRVAFTAQADDQSWAAITGVQGRGRCGPVEGAALQSARAAYARRFPFVATAEGPARALATSHLWEVRPTWIRLIDNTRGFGDKREWGTGETEGDRGSW
ncbi:pyridoxamine 5'-phosphate oxidase [Streptomyces sp. NBC_01166]|uniref:pyridoxamine 5'-phosphate oxidase n=1 Tax=Streptomyces sp. NBC_01166 TaxID=2903755 RepID=UPI003870A93D|nr:pyridoxamine 5'-phosphate oxidase [Streptomyces sp. NBC_01166]